MSDPIPQLSRPYIKARNRPTICYAWRGPSLLVTDHCGRAGEMVQTGYFFRETRYLQHLRFLINGKYPTLCSIAEVDYHTIKLSTIYPEGASGEGEKKGVPFRNLDPRWKFRVRPSSVEAPNVILSKSGSLHVLHQAPTGSLTVGFGDRLGALVGHALPF